MSVICIDEAKCRNCYSCVRRCPVKAIRLTGDRSEVIEDRCLACGLCAEACPQNARTIRDDVEAGLALLQGSRRPRVAVVDHNFPCAFPGIEPGRILGALREAGFDRLLFRTVGAELVGEEYVRFLSERGDERTWISSLCPAVVRLVETQFPHMVENLVPLANNDEVSVRVARSEYGETAAVAVITGCVAAKQDADEDRLSADVVLLFPEVHRLLDILGISPDRAEPSDFDITARNPGRAFTFRGGYLQPVAEAAGIPDERRFVAQGVEHLLPGLRALSKTKSEANFADILLCNGCIDFPGLGGEENRLLRWHMVADYHAGLIRDHQQSGPDAAAGRTFSVDLSASYRKRPLHEPRVTEDEIRKILNELGKFTRENELNCGACGYSTCRDKARAVAAGETEIDTCFPYLLEKMQYFNQEILRSEKMSSIGELASGIAHEINNPLGLISGYAQLLEEDENLSPEMRESISTIYEEIEKVTEVIQNLLNLARISPSFPHEVQLNEILDATLQLMQRSFETNEIEIQRELDGRPATLFADSQQIQQVFTNILLNAQQAMPDGGTITISSEVAPPQALVHFTDTGVGIHREHMDKIFDPFFTTKEPGKGTGLGLSIAYNIVHSHQGYIEVKTKVGHGTTFTVVLPIIQKQ